MITTEKRFEADIESFFPSPAGRKGAGGGIFHELLL